MMSETVATKSNSRGRGNFCILLLFISILSHGILFSSRSINPALVARHIEYSNVARRTTTLTETNGIAVSNKQLRTRKEQPREQLPHWRLATDCSSYHLDCFTTARRENKYRTYPFPPSPNDIQLSHSSSNNGTSKSSSPQWSVETLDRIPEDWIEYLKRDLTPKVPIEERNYLYPPTVSVEDYRSCFALATEQNKSVTEQLDVMLSGESPRIVSEPDTNMVAFTISDYSYVQDMIHDVFQMMDETVGFSPKNFFLVAIDQRSVELSCRYGYPVVLWKANEDNLKDAVANTKVFISHELVKRGIDFFFTEMDVWWIRSPKSNLIDFQNRHYNQQESKDHNQHQNDKHIYFSGHQNNYNAPNIGVYAVKADEYSEEYFRLCLDVLKKKPDTHDQLVLAEVHRLFDHTFRNMTYKFGGKFEPDGPPETPTVQHPFSARMFSPHEVVADERPMPTHQTLAIHTLNGAPLQMPHGKKMIAKELGAYYGFKSSPSIHKNNYDSTTSFSARPSGTDNAGYYERSGETYRKYLWLDGELRSNFYSIAHQDRYHDKSVLQWNMAILIAIARKTNRILILPQIFDADMDAGTYFLWTMMDYSKVNDMVDFRETNFISNSKAWRSSGSSDGPVDDDDDKRWPFESVVNTALFRAEDGDDVSIYTQVSNRSSVVSKRVWKVNLHEHDRLDAWIGSLSTVSELESAEVLLVNPGMMMDSRYLGGVVHRVVTYKNVIDKRNKDIANDNENTSPDEEQSISTNRRIDRQDDSWKRHLPPIGRFELEILEIYDLLRWCWDTGKQHTVSKVSASDSCYGIGEWSN